MKFVDLKKSLNEKILPCYYLVGDDVFLLYKSLELIEKFCTPNMPEFNKIVFSEDSNATAKEIVEACQALPIGDSKRLVVVRDTNLKANKENIEIFSGYLKNPNPDACIVFFCSAPSEIAEKLTAAEKVDCSRLDEAVLKKLIAQKCAKLNKVINDDAAQTLCDYCVRNFARISGEIEKLASFVGEERLITKDDVEKNVVKELEFEGYEFAQAVAGKNTEKAFKILSVMLTGTGGVGVVLSALYNQFSRMFFVRISKMPDSSIASLLSCKEFAVKKTRELAENFSKRSLKNIVELISNLEFEMKSGKIGSKELCERLVFEITSVL